MCAGLALAQTLPIKCTSLEQTIFVPAAGAAGTDAIIVLYATVTAHRRSYRDSESIEA